MNNKLTACLQERNKYLMVVLKGSKIELDNEDLRSYFKSNE